VNKDATYPCPAASPQVEYFCCCLNVACRCELPRALLVHRRWANKGKKKRERVSKTGPVRVLQVTHHGFNTSSTPLFLSRFPPKIAVIQVGADNPYGHPAPEALDRLQRTGAKIFLNDEHGNVIVTIKEGKVDVAVSKPEGAF
jgi:hypothetical protein